MEIKNQPNKKANQQTKTPNRKNTSLSPCEYPEHLNLKRWLHLTKLLSVLLSTVNKPLYLSKNNWQPKIWPCFSPRFYSEFPLLSPIQSRCLMDWTDFTVNQGVRLNQLKRILYLNIWEWGVGEECQSFMLVCTAILQVFITEILLFSFQCKTAGSWRTQRVVHLLSVLQGTRVDLWGHRLYLQYRYVCAFHWHLYQLPQFLSSAEV